MEEPNTAGGSTATPAAAAAAAPDTPPSIPRSERPFSPSPPKENRHTASRPPSLLFGAPPIGTVATSTSISLEGLPPTPSPYASFGESVDRGSNDFFTTLAHRGPRGATAASAASGKEDVASIAQGEFVRGRSVDIPVSRTRSASVSTTSSASPPLGAASILTALAQPAPPKSTTPPTPTTSEPAGHAGPTPPRRTALKRSQSPGSPRSLVSDGASILSEYGAHSAHNSSRSFPRIHQPTVVRRKSGKGVAFLPPPAQVSPTTSGFAIHQPSHHRASMPAGSRHDLEKIRSAGRSRSLSRPAVSDARRPEARTGLDEMMRTGVIRVDPKGGEVEPVQYGGGPASDDVTAYSDDEVREPKMPELGRVVGLREDDAKDWSPSTIASSVVPSPETVFHPTFHEESGPKNRSRRSTSPPLESAADEDGEVVRVEHADDGGPEIAVTGEAKSVAPQIYDDHEALQSGDGHDAPRTDDDHELHEVDAATGQDRAERVRESASNDTLIQEYISAAVHKLTHPWDPLPAEPEIPEELYVPPYRVRPTASRRLDVRPADDGEKLSLVLHANLTRHSRDSPLPFNSAPRVEVRLAWKDRKAWAWVPGVWLIPDWEVRYVRGEYGLVRTVVRGVVGSLPIVWRLAAWL